MRRSYLVLTLLLGLAACGGESTEKNNANQSPNNVNSANSANNGAFGEIAFRLTNTGTSSIFIAGTPFRILHDDTPVEAAWGGCGCGGTECNPINGTFGLRPGVTTAEVWAGELVDPEVCATASDLIGETLEVEICWASNVRSDDGQLVEPTCERKEFVPGTTEAVVFEVQHAPEPRTDAYQLVLENASGAPIYIQTARDCDNYPWWSVQVDGETAQMAVPCGSCYCGEEPNCSTGCTGACRQDSTEEIADGAERAAELDGLFVQPFEQTDATCYQTQYLPAGPLTGQFCWGTEATELLVSMEVCETFTFDLSEAEGRYVVQ